MTGIVLVYLHSFLLCLLCLLLCSKATPDSLSFDFISLRLYWKFPKIGSNDEYHRETVSVRHFVLLSSSEFSLQTVRMLGLQWA